MASSSSAAVKTVVQHRLEERARGLYWAKSRRNGLVRFSWPMPVAVCDRANLRAGSRVQQLCEDARHELFVIASQISSTDGAGKQDVTPDDEGRVIGRADEDDRAGAVAGTADLEREARDLDLLAVVHQAIGGGLVIGIPNGRLRLISASLMR